MATQQIPREVLEEVTSGRDRLAIDKWKAEQLRIKQEGIKEATRPMREAEEARRRQQEVEAEARRQELAETQAAAADRKQQQVKSQMLASWKQAGGSPADFEENWPALWETHLKNETVHKYDQAREAMLKNINRHF